MLVKVCGITSMEAAEAVSTGQADFIGFVFAPSKRRISPKNAAKIAQHIPSSTKKVGVFVNESVENIHFIANLVGLDFIQLHGDEQASFANKINYPIIKAFSINDINPKTIHSYPCDYYLIDSPGEKYRGGSGKTFQWEKLNELNIDRDKLLLAGGLSIDNVEHAIASVRPVGVDVSSGVESDGVKDVKKIKKFIFHAKRPITVTF